MTVNSVYTGIWAIRATGKTSLPARNENSREKALALPKISLNIGLMFTKKPVQNLITKMFGPGRGGSTPRLMGRKYTFATTLTFRDIFTYQIPRRMNNFN